MASQVFQRWNSIQLTSMPFMVWNQHIYELTQIWGAHTLSTRYVYSQLGKSGAKWTDPPKTHFDFTSVSSIKMADLKSWSEAQNLLTNWINLNAAVGVSSLIESYIASIVRLAIESDPGVLLGNPKSIDGTHQLKYGIRQLDLEPIIESCTKGEWASRLAVLHRLFGPLPTAVTGAHSSLEELRKIRNRVGHAFGRDIKRMRRTGVRIVDPMERLSAARTFGFVQLCGQVARSLDKHLLDHHIGDFEAVQFYHNMFPRLHAHVLSSQRAVYFKKEVGQYGLVPRSKEYCRKLVSYYESI